MILADRLARMPEAPTADATYANIAALTAYAGQMARYNNLASAQADLSASQVRLREEKPDDAITGLSFLIKKDTTSTDSA